jgi:hypothetical protein
MNTNLLVLFLDRSAGGLGGAAPQDAGGLGRTAPQDAGGLGEQPPRIELNWPKKQKMRASVLHSPLRVQTFNCNTAWFSSYRSGMQVYINNCYTPRNLCVALEGSILDGCIHFGPGNSSLWGGLNAHE